MFRRVSEFLKTFGFFDCEVSPRLLATESDASLRYATSFTLFLFTLKRSIEAAGVGLPVI